VELVAIFTLGWARPSPAGGGLLPDNVKQLGLALYQDYLIPFEVASVLLLAAMIGAIVMAKREL
jgi:NADH-quinone oxidoreductase subunit J